MSASDLGPAGYVMPEFAFAILIASAFTFGCAVIHEWREHARHMTPILASITTGLALLAGMIALAESGPVSLSAGDVRSGFRAEPIQLQQQGLETIMAEARAGSAKPSEKDRETNKSAGQISLGENGLPHRRLTPEEQNAANRTLTTVKHSLKRGSQETERAVGEK